MKKSWYVKAETKIMTFENDRKVECEVVDLNSPEFDALLNNAPYYIKNAEVQARQATKPEEILTPLDATKNIVAIGDWVVTNPGGETYTVKNNTFMNAYRPKPNEPGKFMAVGIPVKAVRVTRNIVFVAPWGEDQAVEAGGYVVERSDNKERYGIEQQAFLTTYQFLE